MNTKRTSFTDSLILGLPLLMLGLIFLAGTATAAVNAERPTESLATEKPVNEPTFETHAAQAREACGGEAVKPGEGVVADAVAVVRLNGKVERMSTDKAFTATPGTIWVIGACVA